MHKLYYQPEGYWFGDCMPFSKDGVFYVYHQRDTRNPAPFGEPFGWALATTTDFVNYKNFGESLKRGRDDEPDQFIYAGSVFEDKDGNLHAFYTGYNREFLKVGKVSQVLMHATSDDLVDWNKSEEKLKLVPPKGYSQYDFRDPYVIWDEENQEYFLILGARAEGDKRKQTGRLVTFTSKNLKDWNFQGDFWSPGIYTMFEMPEIFKIGEWWYLVYSEYSQQNKILYRMSKSLKGPWIRPKDDAFDGSAYYAGRTAFDGNRRILFGWVPTKLNCEDMNQYEWGGTLVPHEVYQREDGTLGTKVPDSVWNTFTNREELESLSLKTIDTREEAIICKDAGRLFAFETTIKFEEGTREFSIRFYEDEELSEAYEYKFSLVDNRFTFDKNPNYKWFQMMNKGLERPIYLDVNKEYNLRLIVDDTISTLYIDGVALNARIYKKFGDAIALTVTYGAITTSNTTISKTLNR